MLSEPRPVQTLVQRGSDASKSRFRIAKLEERIAPTTTTFRPPTPEQIGHLPRKGNQVGV
jgi:hypothetical protein